MLGKELSFKMNKSVEAIEISGIRKFFNKVSKYPNAISLTALLNHSGWNHVSERFLLFRISKMPASRWTRVVSMERLS